MGKIKSCGFSAITPADTRHPREVPNEEVPNSASVTACVTTTAAKLIIGLFTSPPTAEGLCWNTSTLVPYPFAHLLLIQLVPNPWQYQEAISHPGSHHSPRQSRECGGRPGQQRGGFPRDGSSGQRTSSKQEPVKPLPAPHFRWLSTPAAAVNAKQGTTGSSPSAGSCTLIFMALSFSVQNSILNDYRWFGDFTAAPIVAPISQLYCEDKIHMDHCSILTPCGTCK